MTMSRGDISKTIARMEELGAEMRAVRDGFQAVGDSQVNEICTDADYTLRRWAWHFAGQLHRINEQRAHVVGVARDGGNLPKL